MLITFGASPLKSCESLTCELYANKLTKKKKVEFEQSENHDVYGCSRKIWD